MDTSSYSRLSVKSLLLIPLINSSPAIKLCPKDYVICLLINFYIKYPAQHEQPVQGRPQIHADGVGLELHVEI